MPAISATKRAARLLSPVRSTGWSPSRFSSATAAALESRAREQAVEQGRTTVAVATGDGVGVDHRASVHRLGDAEQQRRQRTGDRLRP